MKTNNKIAIKYIRLSNIYNLILFAFLSSKEHQTKFYHRNFMQGHKPFCLARHMFGHYNQAAIKQSITNIIILIDHVSSFMSLSVC